jgi:hypothetical protein
MPRIKQLSQIMGGALLLTLGACGGSSGDVSGDVTLKGTVMVNQAVRNAVVCLDLNANSQCDPDEPASSKTGADGAYSLSYDSSKLTAAQVTAASLIAPMVPGLVDNSNTTIDAADPTSSLTETSYVLRQVAGKSGQINPLTTLVQAGVATGMTEAVARTNVALQLAIAEKTIDDYQSDAALTGNIVQDSARMMAVVTAAVLEQGGTLTVGDQNAAIVAASSDLRSLRYTDAANFQYSTYSVLAKAAGTSGLMLQDQRTGMTAGTATAHAALYNQAYLSPTGWRYCDENVPLSSTRGVPNRTVFCNSLTSTGFTAVGSVASRTMSDVVTEMQADSASNTINNGVSTTNLLNALGTATFPSGSVINTRYTINLNSPIFINSISGDARPQNENTLELLIAAKPSSAVKLATGGGTLGLGQGSSTARALRVAFSGISSATSGTVQFYECDLNNTTSAISNCVATQTGTYAISTVNGARVMRFSGHADTVMNHTRLYAEVTNVPDVYAGNAVFQARENKSNAGFSISKRLNASAWSAMKTQLGL